MTELFPFVLLGATGRVGRMVARSLRTGSGPYTDIALQTRRMEYPSSAKHIPWDILLDDDGLGVWIASYGRPNALVVLSGVTPATGARMDDNIDLAVRCLEAARRYGIRRVLLTSSSAVYGPGQGHPLSEGDTCNPLNDYGRSKLKMEEAILGATSSEWQTEVCCMRIGNVVGADALLLNSVGGQALTIDRFADGHGPLRSYISPGDLAQTIAGLATDSDSLPSVINIAAPQPVRMEALASAAGLNWHFTSAPETALQAVTLDCKKLIGRVPFLQITSDPDAMIEDWKRNKCDDLDKAYL